MDKHLSDRFTSLVDVFNLLRSYVLSLCQFKDVLFPVDDLQGAILFGGRGAACEQVQQLLSARQRAFPVHYHLILITSGGGQLLTHFADRQTEA